jgi:BRG1-associated factor 45A
MNSQSNICYMCKLADDEADEELMTCSSCQHHFHPICLDVNAEMLTIIKTYPWQCIDCKSCAKCDKAHDEVRKRMKTERFDDVHL